ncbi:hypothetical protein FPV67DRAFT_1628838 [Lyophyllum atratum]|nr:hypothetical protein FPV67DRAFT_1628838 [Lyophyllum atratum]
MASSSTFRSARSPNLPFINPHDLDVQTSMLIAQLTLQDISEISRSRKGKARADAPLSDEEVAIRMQREYGEDIVRYANDRLMARSLHDAIEVDRPILNALSIVERAAEDDHRAAVALSNGEALPPPSNAQRLVEDPAFFQLSEPWVAFLRQSILDPNLEEHSGDTSATKADEGSVDDLSVRMERLVISLGSKGKVGSVQTVLKSRPQKRAQCISCGDLVRGSAYLKGPCDHDYCPACVADLVDACCRDESLYPPRCCNQPFPNEALAQFLKPMLLATYTAKRMELDVPAANRIFCPVPTCSTFLGSSENAQDHVQCNKCNTFVCPQCRQPSHFDENCSENQATLAVRELALAEHWQTCPGCRAIVELQMGCYHITCRCRYEFCYICASPWKNCGCPQWNEERLLDTAQQRVEQENVGRAPIAPLVRQEQIRQMANTIRDNHDCVGHSWRRRNGSGDCEECGNWLRDFLLNCRNCHLMACVRCARNRL